MSTELTAQRCAATARSGKPCGQYAIPGGTVCYYHGGNAPQVRAKALERLEFARDKALARLTAQLEPEAPPIDAATLLAIVDKLTAKIELLQGRATERHESAHVRADLTRDAINAALDRVALRVQPGEVIDVETVGDGEG